MPASNYIGNYISLLESSYIDINYYFISLIAIKISVPYGNCPPVFVLTYGNAVKQSTL